MSEYISRSQGSKASKSGSGPSHVRTPLVSRTASAPSAGSPQVTGTEPS